MAMPTRASKRLEKNKAGDTLAKRPAEDETVDDRAPPMKKKKKQVASTKDVAKRPAKGKAGDAVKDKANAKVENTVTHPVQEKAQHPAEHHKKPDATHDETYEDGHAYWLMKAEPESRIEKGVDVKFSIDDLAAAKEPEGWDGVRNAVARNNMRAMKKGDQAFFYHSNCKTPGVVGTMEIVKEHSTDVSAQNPNHPYYDPKETAENPRWSLVHVEFKRKFPNIISLKELQKYKGSGDPLEELQTLKQSRLSVSKVSRSEWNFILSLLEEQESS